MKLDEQEAKILKALIKDPRMSDNQIGKLTRVPIRTVSRKRKKMEEEGKIKYFTKLNSDDKIKHLYIIKFEAGITKQKLKSEIKEEPKIKSLFTSLISQSFFAEIDGHTAILMIVEGDSDVIISENFNGKIFPLMEKNHGKGTIKDVSTIRINENIRIFHNYMPFINMKNGKIRKDWPMESIY